MKLTISILCGLVLVAAQPLEAAKRAFTIEDLYRVRSISDVQISPDGRSILYAMGTSNLPKAKRTTHIWLMDADGRNPRQLTQGEKSSSSPAFSPDGRWISFISSRDGSSNIYLLPRNGGEPKKFTNVSTGVSDPLWSPDSRWIAFSSDVYPECGGDDTCNKKIADTWTKGSLKAHVADSLLARHWSSWKDGTRTHILVADVTSGKVKDVTPGPFDAPNFQLGGPLQYDFAPDSSELAYVSNHDPLPASSTNNDLWLVSLKGGAPAPARNITSSNPAYDGSPKYSPDGRYIAYRRQKDAGYESSLFSIALFDRNNGTSKVITSSFNNWIDELEWAPDSRSILFTGGVEGINPIFRISTEGGEATRLFADKTIDEFALSQNGNVLVYTGRSVGAPVEMYAVDLTSPNRLPRVLTSVNKAIVDEVDIRPAESMWIEGSEGAKIQTFIVKPHNFNPAKKYPLILNVHGGPQSMFGDAFRGDWQVYPGQGYVVAFANPHGSTGYGQEFTAQISGEWGGRVYEDLMKVTDALERLPYVDRNRMGAMGWSYGGYMMNWFQGHTTRFKALASMMGLYDLRSFYGETEELWFPEWDLKGQPWNSDLYEKWSPSNFVKNFKTPTLVITGERDYRVSYTQSLQFFTALQKMNVPSKLIVYSDAGHWPSWYEMALYYTAHLEWFQKYLGGGGPPWTTEAFLRNAVFDSDSGKRVEPDKTLDESAKPPRPAEQEKKPGGTKAPKSMKGKPAQKPGT